MVSPGIGLSAARTQPAMNPVRGLRPGVFLSHTSSASAFPDTARTPPSFTDNENALSFQLGHSSPLSAPAGSVTPATSRRREAGGKPECQGRHDAATHFPSAWWFVPDRGIALVSEGERGRGEPMTRRVDRGRIRGRVHALAAIAAALSFLVVSVAEASHSHSHEDEAESVADCSVCQLGTRPGHTTGSHVPDLTGPNLRQAPAIAGHRSAPAVLHFSSRRSRAPPPAISA